MLFYFTLLVAALLAGLGLTPLTIRLARRWNVVDSPDPRKVHDTPRPRIGGLALTVSVLGMGLAWSGYAWQAGAIAQTTMAQLLMVALAGLCVCLMGLVDDLWSIPSKYKTLGLVAAAAAVASSGARLDQLIWNDHQAVIDLGLAGWPITVLWITGVTVSIAFIDGIDGLAAGMVAIAASTVAAYAMTGGAVAEAILPLALVGGLLGFLPYNFSPARTFMGDCGSLLIGFVVASAAVVAAPELGTMRAVGIPTLALSVPLLDVAVTLFRRRMMQRRSIFSAEQGHIHHHMTRLGLTHQKIVLLLYGFSVLAVMIGEVSMMSRGWITLGGLLLMIPLLLGLFRAAGSVHMKNMVSAVQQKRYLDREGRRYDRTFEELQLLFAGAQSFNQWWQAVCRAADRLDFAWLELPLTHRDGGRTMLHWRPPDNRFADAKTLTATVPVKERRATAPLHASVEVAAEGSLELAGRRVALFSRLMDEHSVASLPDTAGDPEGLSSSGPTPAATEPAEANEPEPVLPPVRVKGRDNADTLAGRPRVAIVHDFLYIYGGAERVIEQMLSLFPQAELFSLFDFLPADQRGFLQGRSVTTSFLQRMVGARKHHRLYLPLMPLAAEQFDLSGYDLVLSSSYLAAKGVITGPDQPHICYCHSPARYAWDLQHQYLNHSRMGRGLPGIASRSVLHYLRNWDVRSSTGVDLFLANSRFVAQRIHKLYRRPAKIVHPPVPVEAFELGEQKEPLYVTASRLVPYKRVDLIVEAFNRMPDRKLVVVGSGPELPRLKRLAGPNVRVVGQQPFERLQRYLQLAQAFVFAAEEDFGIAPVEAMACGTPVIAFGRGGATDTVVAEESGVFFQEQSAEAITAAVTTFEQLEGAFDPAAIREHARRFDARRFREQLGAITDAALEGRLADIERSLMAGRDEAGDTAADRPACEPGGRPGSARPATGDGHGSGGGNGAAADPAHPDAEAGTLAAVYEAAAQPADERTGVRPGDPGRP